MKKTLKLSAFLLGFALVFGASCKKYEEGPSLSFASKKGRVANTWVIEKMIVDGDEIDKDFYEGIEIEYTKDGKYTSKLDGDVFSEGTWEFGDKKETLITKDNDDDEKEEVTITKLKSKEFWTKDTENNITSEIHLKEK